MLKIRRSLDRNALCHWWNWIRMNTFATLRMGDYTVLFSSNQIGPLSSLQRRRARASRDCQLSESTTSISNHVSHMSCMYWNYISSFWNHCYHDNLHTRIVRRICVHTSYTYLLKCQRKEVGDIGKASSNKNAHRRSPLLFFHDGPCTPASDPHVT